MLAPDAARKLAESLVEKGLAAGAGAADAIYVGNRSSGVQVRLGELEDVQRSEGEEIGLRLFVGQRSATTASSDLSDEALAALVERCLAMAREAPEDLFAGLAPTELLQLGALPQLDSDDPREPDPAELRARALEAETAARAVAGVTNSNGGSASASATIIALATSGGFSGVYRATGHSTFARTWSVSGSKAFGSSSRKSSRWTAMRSDGGSITARTICTSVTKGSRRGSTKRRLGSTWSARARFSGPGEKGSRGVAAWAAAALATSIMNTR